MDLRAGGACVSGHPLQAREGVYVGAGVVKHILVCNANAAEDTGGCPPLIVMRNFLPLRMIHIVAHTFGGMDIIMPIPPDIYKYTGLKFVKII